eukprot:TRINITY_DN16455_c0_g1_i6.p2 TRINITY_DN16455_c0_g1~~TRINITY_DN16455_c0_g1_i6.p2  ORF type:complete len:114 (+),score=4.48 TRINITY_DN16455_c0_g1_i6:173-514(+)
MYHCQKGGGFKMNCKFQDPGGFLMQMIAWIICLLQIGFMRREECRYEYQPPNFEMQSRFSALQYDIICKYSQDIFVVYIFGQYYPKVLQGVVCITAVVIYKFKQIALIFELLN